MKWRRRLLRRQRKARERRRLFFAGASRILNRVYGEGLRKLLFGEPYLSGDYVFFSSHRIGKTEAIARKLVTTQSEIDRSLEQIKRGMWRGLRDWRDE